MIPTSTANGKQTLEEVPLFIIDPSLRFVEIFTPTGVEEDEFDERFSTTGNEEIW